MNSPVIFDELDQAIDRMMATPDTPPANSSPQVAELLGVASDLRDLPRADFKMRLRAELEWQASGRLMSNSSEWPAATHANFTTETRRHGENQDQRQNLTAEITEKKRRTQRRYEC